MAATPYGHLRPLLLALVLLAPHTHWAPWTSRPLPAGSGAGGGWGPVYVSAVLPESVAYKVYPAMVGWDNPELPTWESIVHAKERKYFDPGSGHYAQNGSVLQGHIGGLYDHHMAEHLKYACEGEGRGCKRKLCTLARDDWCKEYYNQPPIPWRTSPRGDKDCPATQYGTCNGLGSCQYDIGVCMCPAGWRGPDCSTRDPRPCTHRYRTKEQDGAKMEPISHSGPDGRDLNWDEPGWTASRCAGFCDDDLSMCYCPPGTTYGRQPAPPGSPPGTPPLKPGRPLGDSCKPNKNPVTGAKVDWGHVDPDMLFGPKGWCNMEHPGMHCGCPMDGTHGHTCDIVSETFCFNQCSGRGECLSGFCKCHEGWYGFDCSRQRASAKTKTKGDHETGGSKPYLTDVVQDPPAAQDPPPAPTRRRPLIYVYDTDPVFNTRMMQYRNARTACVYRLFGPSNDTHFNNYVYALESYWIETLTTSQHRTYDPDEADFFFVPVQLTCYLWPVLGWADHPWFGMPAAHSRAHQGSNMYLAAKKWIQQHYPYWDRRGGRDHIWMMLNDEGGCWMPTEIYNTSIVLSHWGRMDDIHVSGTAWGYDNYSHPLPAWPPYTTGDWRTLYDGHPCYTPGKDLIIPSLKAPEHYSTSPLLGAPPMERDILLYLRGDTGPYRAHWYSRGVRQRLAKLAFKNDWAAKYRIFLGESWQIHGSYTEHLARSIFCLVVPGDGWSARAEDAILHGCIPLVFMDGVHAVYESIFEWDAFAVRLKETAANENLPQVLMSFSPEQIERMQRRLATVWHRFAYATGSVLSAAIERQYANNRNLRRSMHSSMKAAVESRETAAAAVLGRLSGGAGGGRSLQQLLDEGGAGGGGGKGGRGGAVDEWMGPVGHPYTATTRFPTRMDAWHTIMAWLHSRIPHTR